MVVCLEIDISVKMKDEKMLTAIDHKQNRTQTIDWLNEMQYWKSSQDLQRSLNLEILKFVE